MALVDELYPAEQCSIIKSLYSDDPETQHALMVGIGKKVVENETMLVSPALDIIAMIFTTATFCKSNDEPHVVAVMVHKHINNPDPLPMISTDVDLTLSEKTLVSLALFGAAMSRRHTRRGAPSPDFYRQTSKMMLRRHHLDDVADNHERWEAFIAEMFIS